MKETKLKPFDLQAALEGKPVVTRDGQPVKIAGYNPDYNKDCNILGWVDNKLSCDWHTDGSYMDIRTEHHLDLFMAPEKREVWVCYYRIDGLQGVSLGNSKDSAEIIPYADKSIIVTTVKIWEEEI